ncbi:MAG TPA: peptidoglycan DD-metalloendopeptidase family protein [Solirubrobacterales bacterium]
MLRYSTRDLIVAAIVAIASFGAGLVFAGAADARAGEPAVDGVRCVTDCDGKSAAIGSAVELTGSGLEDVEVVKFASDAEKRVKAKPEKTADDAVEATVPAGAVTGKPRVVDSERNKSTSPKELVIAGDGTDPTDTTLPSDPNDPTQPGADPGTGDATGDTSPDGISVDPDKGFFKGKRTATAHVASGSATELQVVSADDGTAVATVPVKDEGTGEATAKWDGVTDDGEVAPNGEYEFGGGGGDSAAFEQYDHIFPVNGKHEYGDGIGAGRGHQGQDVFADCGIKMVAARAGKVEHVDSHESAGNYLVIDGKKTDTDYVYMHLQEVPTVAEGDKVKTGQAIGHVGETGNASGCHLHFEMWDSGWQQGEPADPEPELKKWDGWS